MTFVKGQIAWNKGTHIHCGGGAPKGSIPPNKGKKGLQVAWNKGLIGYGKGRITAEETRQKLSLKLKGRVLTPEWKEKISIGNRGKTTWVGRKHSSVTKLKMAQITQERWLDPIYAKEMRKVLRHERIKKILRKEKQPFTCAKRYNKTYYYGRGVECQAN